jgi:heme-degrading monooxygenase HmoA
VIARIWRGWIRPEDGDSYIAYLNRTGMAEYTKTPGNRGAWILTRPDGNGRTEIITFSFWESWDAVTAFAGEDVDRAVFYPEDDRYLVDREERVVHYEVAG